MTRHELRKGIIGALALLLMLMALWTLLFALTAHADEMVYGKARGVTNALTPNRFSNQSRLPAALINGLTVWLEFNLSEDSTNAYSLITAATGIACRAAETYWTNYNGGCRVFAGVAGSNAVVVQDAIWGQMTGFTYAVWCRPTDRGDGKNRCTILSKNTAFSANNLEGELLWLTSGAGQANLEYQYFDASAQRLYTSTFMPILATWNLLSVTVSGTNVEIWANGTNFLDSAQTGIPSDVSSAPAYIGSLGQRYFDDYLFVGYISEVYKWSVVLTHAQQTNLWTSTKWRYGY